MTHSIPILCVLVIAHTLWGIKREWKWMGFRSKLIQLITILVELFTIYAFYFVQNQKLVISFIVLALVLAFYHLWLALNNRLHE